MGRQEAARRRFSISLAPSTKHLPDLSVRFASFHHDFVLRIHTALGLLGNIVDEHSTDDYLSSLRLAKIGMYHCDRILRHDYAG